MCLAIPGKVVETYQEHEMLMGKIDFGGVSNASALNTCPRCELANMSWSTSVSPFP